MKELERLPVFLGINVFQWHLDATFTQSSALRSTGYSQAVVHSTQLHSSV